MDKYIPSCYVTWIKHISAYPCNVKIVSVEEMSISIVVHPAHPALVIPFSENINQIISKEDKTLQLYFYSLAWLIPVLMSGEQADILGSLRVLECVLNITSRPKDSGRWNMLWDDHAISERLCVLLEIKGLPIVIDLLGTAILEKIDDHVNEIVQSLASILDDVKWEKNNHRLFHLLAAFIYAHASRAAESKNIYRSQINEFINGLIDYETGFSFEQSIAYCSFDLAIVKNIIKTMNKLSAPLSIDSEILENKLNSHMAAIAFPDGSLPASGDSAHGLMLSPYQRRFKPQKCLIAKYWQRIDRLGYYRGCSNDETIHYMVLSHNAESAHGHASPLHIDLWFVNFGFVLVDAGGPFKYGAKIRYEWYKATRGHNSLSLSRSNQQQLEKLSIDMDSDRSSFRGEAYFKTSTHRRQLVSGSHAFDVYEEVTSDEEWELYYNFAEGCTIVPVANGAYKLSKPENDYHLIVTTNLDPSLLSIQLSDRCTGHSRFVQAPSLVLSSNANSLEWHISFKQLRNGGVNQ